MLANNLKKVRKAKGISQKELAQKLNTTQQTVSSWEIGRTIPRPYQQQFMENFFDTPKEVIFFGAYNYNPL